MSFFDWFTSKTPSIPAAELQQRIETICDCSTPPEMIQFWGQDLMVRWNAGHLKGAKIPEAAKTFLSQVGLPEDIGDDFHFEPSNKTLPEGLVIGTDAESQICIGADGKVTAIHPEDRPWPMNTSVDRLARCLILYQQVQRLPPDANDEQTEQLIDRIRAELARVEPELAEDDDGYWVMFLEP